ncbi:MAG: hypothetical protein HQK53_14760 [Oligoflexia bacterium]|nr:hypothetical protein [Oligoflexia bacterium]
MSVAKCNGTFGELVQGKISGQNFMITCPINRYSYAYFSASVSVSTNYADANCDVHDKNDNEKGVQLLTPERHKAYLACLKVLDQHGLPRKGSLRIESDLIPGKGMASSSADIVATCRAVAKFHHLILSEKLIAQIAATIEPTDGVMYEEIVAFDHHRGVLIEPFGNINFDIIGVVPSGCINTVTYDSKKIKYNLKELKALEEAFLVIKKGIFDNNLSLVGRGSSISALINQSYLPKNHIKKLLEISKKSGGKGVIVAHSGTVIGVIVDPILGNEKKSIQLAIEDLYGCSSEIFRNRDLF